MVLSTPFFFPFILLALYFHFLPIKIQLDITLSIIDSNFTKGINILLPLDQFLPCTGGNLQTSNFMESLKFLCHPLLSTFSHSVTHTQTHTFIRTSFPYDFPSKNTSLCHSCVLTCICWSVYTHYYSIKLGFPLEVISDTLNYFLLIFCSSLFA